MYGLIVYTLLAALVIAYVAWQIFLYIIIAPWFPESYEEGVDNEDEGQ